MGGAISTGAKGTAAFGSYVDRNMLPPESSITYEGMLYKHKFNVGEQEKEKYFSPRYFKSKSKNPITGDIERHVCIGMSGKLDGKGLYEHNERLPLNTVIVMDISGSMGSRMGDKEKNCMAVAKESMLGMLSNIRDDDCLGIVLFDTTTENLLPLTRWSDVDKDALKQRIEKVQPRGGTNLEKGYKAGKIMLEDALKDVKEKREHRMFFFTDMQINAGAFAKDLQPSFEAMANKKIYTTFVGIGAQFDTSAVSIITDTRGCNYFTVKTPKEFNDLLVTDFDYITTIDCYNIKIEFKAQGHNVKRVYGSPGCEQPQEGVLCQIKSTCPSIMDDKGRTKGSVILVKMDEPEDDASSNYSFDTSYETRQDDKVAFTDKLEFTQDNEEEDYFENNCIRKAVLLIRYVEFIKDLLTSGAESIEDVWIEKMEKFKKYYDSEIDALSSSDEEDLTSELELFEKLQTIVKKAVEAQQEKDAAKTNEEEQ
mmetsp:Transcript_22804/g.25383  ORF Transcript_22804/g.25383 Transcript_22804/m.25383 type:complete len:481 (+) Transcript_22804:181-1623(+)